MFQLMQLSNTLMLNEGLNGLTDNLRDNWVGPVFLLIVAGVSINFLIHREFRKLMVFAALAALIGMMIYFGNDVFGNNGSLSKFAQKEAVQINTILPKGDSFNLMKFLQ